MHAERLVGERGRSFANRPSLQAVPWTSKRRSGPCTAPGRATLVAVSGTATRGRQERTVRFARGGVFRVPLVHAPDSFPRGLLRFLSVAPAGGAGGSVGALRVLHKPSDTEKILK